MNSDLEQAIDDGVRLFEVWIADGRLPWWGVQTAIILVLFGAAVWLARRIEPALESRVRHIKQNRDLLRIAAAMLRRIHWPI